MRNEASFREQYWQAVSSRSQENAAFETLRSQRHAAKLISLDSGYPIVPDLAVLAQI